MRIFHCERCGNVVSFAAQRCPTCDATLGYLSEESTIRTLLDTSDPVVFAIEGRDQPVWRCLNAAWGCNWVVDAGSDTPWCRSCRLTRGRPDDARQDAIEAWIVAEAAKRRLLHQLDELSLPVEVRSATAPDGLAFDLVHLPGHGGITGHLDGVVTLDLAEVDDRHRDDLRRRLGEPYRTVIGHLRHEIGHHYWGRLVGQSSDVKHFRRLFGDERSDYRTSIERFYTCPTASWDHARFVSPYAASHPFEDWAETFAHYLHIADATDTAIAHDLVPHRRTAAIEDPGLPSDEFTAMLDTWRPINAAVNAIAESLGAPAVYPFDPSAAVIEKLAFVHQQIRAHARRDRFYASN
jgi:hypothetical protein